jgi:hypothetical protein
MAGARQRRTLPKKHVLEKQIYRKELERIPKVERLVPKPLT